ncbi:DUF4258 domain-containing protein [Paenibacillus chitinolyticus]|uniref:DUF4258 domain-containing protein n=1 Tax=Paenibacillus chitinolyticus TaxID=79263 RepID=UPI003558E2CA
MVSAVLTKIQSLATQGNYFMTKHARIQMIQRGLTDADVRDILMNPNQILRTDTNNPDGVTSYKIKGGQHDHRLAIKFVHNPDELIVIITVMDNQIRAN